MNLRHPRTTNEARQFDRKLVRAKRSRRQLANYYDDVPTNGYRSWKEHRKTQYK